MDKIDLITLLLIPKIGRKTVHKLLEYDKSFQFGNIKDMLNYAKELNSKFTVPTSDTIEGSMHRANKILEDCNNNMIKITTVLDNDFPESLKNIDDYPIVLYYKGILKDHQHRNHVTIVGTRIASDHGKNASRRVGEYFGSKDFVVVSGLAKGIDEMAHMGCLDSHGTTIAILPCGLDSVYPASNYHLANRIIDGGGCLISEYPVGSEVNKGSFIDRDRLQSGLSKAVISVEMLENSGTMNTINFAMKQGKIIACYDNRSIVTNSSESNGNVNLINKKLAIPISSKFDMDQLIEKIRNTEISSNYRANKDCEQLRFDLEKP